VDATPQDGLLKLEELEARIRRAVEELRRLREQCDAALAEREKLRAALKERGQTVQRLEARLLELQTEREQVRGRIEHLVAQIDSLTQAE
jgi:predicted  nucleic acid-binding Zn-ribbon protein